MWEQLKVRALTAGMACALGVTGCNHDTDPVPRVELSPPARMHELDTSVRRSYEEMKSRFDLMMGSVSGPVPASKRADAYALAGDWYYAYEHAEQATTAFEACRDADPARTRCRYALATLYRTYGQSAAALEEYNQVILLTEPSPYLPALVWSAFTAIDQGNLDDAARLLKRALPEDTGAMSLLGLARIALRQERPDKAKQLIESALLRAPGATILLYTLAQAERDLGNDTRHRTILERLPRRNRDHEPLTLADPWLQRIDALGVNYVELMRAGIAARKSGRMEHAIELFHKAIEADDQNIDARLQLAQVYIDTGRPATAESILETARIRFPKDARILFQLSRAHMLQGRLETAAQFIDLAIKADPENTRSALLQAEIWLRMGKNEIAIRVLRDLRAARPHNSEIARVLVQSLYLLGMRDEAYTTLERAMSDMPRDAALEKLSESMSANEKGPPL